MYAVKLRMEGRSWPNFFVYTFYKVFKFKKKKNNLTTLGDCLCLPWTYRLLLCMRLKTIIIRSIFEQICYYYRTLCNLIKNKKNTIITNVILYSFDYSVCCNLLWSYLLQLKKKKKIKIESLVYFCVQHWMRNRIRVLVTFSNQWRNFKIRLFVCVQNFNGTQKKKEFIKNCLDENMNYIFYNYSTRE